MELLPCPFCDGEATLQAESDYVYARCLKCDSHGRAFYYIDDAVCGDIDEDEQNEKAIKAWNTRTPAIKNE